MNRQERRKQELAAYAELGRSLGEAIRMWRPSVTVEHKVTYGLQPQPTWVGASIVNANGERWMLQGFRLAPGQSHVKLNSFPAVFLDHNLPNDLHLGGIELLFEWDKS